MTTRGLRVGGAVLVAGLALSAPGCANRGPVPAVGPSNEISVFTNVPRESAAMDTLRAVFERNVNVVSKEQAFVLDFVAFEHFDVHREVKNQIFAVNLSVDDALSRAVPGPLGVEGRRLMKDHRPFRLLIHDVYARGQTTLFVIGWSETDLRDALSEIPPIDLLREYETSVIRGLTETMYTLGDEPELARQVANEFGWTVHLPTGYFASSDPEHDFVKFNADEPPRFLLVHWTDEPLPLDPATWDPILAWMLTTYNDGDFADSSDTYTYAGSFQGRPALRWEGIWQNEKYTIGGPLRAVAFRADDRSYIMAMEMFAPGAVKLPTLRQIEAIATTFRPLR